MRSAPRLVLALAGAAALFVAGVKLAHRYAYAERLLHPQRRAVTAEEEKAAHALSPELREVSFVTADGLALRGWFVPPRNGMAIVMGHGHGENRASFLCELGALARHGYGALAFDWRAQGASDGALVTSGDRERLDAKAAIDFVSRQPGVLRIGALGFSMGASPILLEAAGDPRVRALLLYATWPSLDEELRDKFGLYAPLARWQFVHAGIDVDAVAPRAHLAELAPRPLLFAIGSLDADTPPSIMRALFDTAPPPKSFWQLEGVSHGGYCAAQPAEFARRATALFDPIEAGARGAP